MDFNCEIQPASKTMFYFVVRNQDYILYNARKMQFQVIWLSLACKFIIIIVVNKNQLNQLNKCTLKRSCYFLYGENLSPISLFPQLPPQVTLTAQ